MPSAYAPLLHDASPSRRQHRFAVTLPRPPILFANYSISTTSFNAGDGTAAPAQNRPTPPPPAYTRCALVTRPYCLYTHTARSIPPRDMAAYRTVSGYLRTVAGLAHTHLPTLTTRHHLLPYERGRTAGLLAATLFTNYFYAWQLT